MRPPISNRKPRGVTLLEILAVIAIMVVLSVLAIPALNLWRAQSSVKYAARTVQSLLGEARGLAIARGQEFTVEIDTNAESMVIKDSANAPVSKKWLAPASVDIKDISGREGIITLRFNSNGNCIATVPKPSGGTETYPNVSIHLKRRDASDADSSKYYTVVTYDTPGTSRIYSTKQN